MLPPHELSGDFLREKEHIKKLAENYIFKILNDSDTFSVPNSKNLNNSKNCYETNQIHFHLKGNR